MRRRSRAGGESPNAQAPKAVARKSRIAPKAVRPRSSSAATRKQRSRGSPASGTRRWLQQTATSEILSVISQSPTDVRPSSTPCRDRSASAAEPTRCLCCFADGEHRSTRPRALVIAEISNTSDNDLCARAQASLAAFGRQEDAALPDVLTDPEYDAGDTARLGRIRTTLLPLLREESVIGVLRLSESTQYPRAVEIKLVRPSPTKP